MYTSQLLNYITDFFELVTTEAVKFAVLLEQIYSGFSNLLDFTGFQMRHSE